MLERGFGIGYSAFFRVSAFRIRIWAAGGGWYYPDTPAALSGSPFFIPVPRNVGRMKRTTTIYLVDWTSFSMPAVSSGSCSCTRARSLARKR